MGILKRSFDPSKARFQQVKEGEMTSCFLPVEEPMTVQVHVRAPKSVNVFLTTPEGESSVLLASGQSVDWRGRVEAGGVEIAADTSFWYQCHQSRLFEFIDPVPMKIELQTTEQDILKVMIEERLRQYKHAYEVTRELSEDEKDELILDIARGDLEFEPGPDEFGLGYAERLEEYAARHAEQNTGEGEPSPVPAAEPATPPVPPAAGANSSST